VFITHFPTTTGRGKFVPADLISADERPDDGTRWCLSPQQLEHWHTGGDDARATVLDYIEPEPVASFHPLDLDKVGVKPGISSRWNRARGKIALYARADDGTPTERCLSVLLLRSRSEHVDEPKARPDRKIPEFQVLRGEGHQRRADARCNSSFGGGQALASCKKQRKQPNTEPGANGALSFRQRRVSSRGPVS